MSSHPEKTQGYDRVRHYTNPAINERIDRRTDDSIRCYAAASPAQVRQRIDELEREWDIERALEVNAATLALTGLLLGFQKKKGWFALPVVVLTFLLQHGVQGWCPPLPLLRRLGFRTRGEIDREKYGLKALLPEEGSGNHRALHPGITQLG